MTLIFRRDLTRPLNATEFDGNTDDFNGRVSTLEAAGIGVGIASFSVTGNQLYVHMTDASVLGPYTLPSPSWLDLFTGAWQAAHAYTAGQLFTILGSVYGVLVNHTSASTFDPNANDGAGHNFYELVLTVGGIPVYSRSSSTFAPTLGVANSMNRYTNAGGCTVTLPSDATSNFPIGSVLYHKQTTDNEVVFAAGSGATILGVTGFLNATAIKGAVVTTVKVDANTWDIWGFLKPA